MKLKFRRADVSRRIRLLLTGAVLGSLASLPGQVDAAGAKPVTACSALSERTAHEYTILSATDLESVGAVPERSRLLGVLPP